MLRGTTTFVCDDCGYKFKGLDVEWCATVMSAPVRCPKCGGYHTAPAGSDGILKSIYRKIWKSSDEIK